MNHLRGNKPYLMKRAFLVAAFLIFGLGACGEKPAPTPPPPAAKAPEVVPTPPPPAPAAETAPTPPAPPAPAAPKEPAPKAAEAPPRAAATPLQAGLNFELINPPQPTDNPKKVEVIEFFWYACPHCNALQPSLRTWLKKKPADVDFKRVPAVLQDSWLQLARTYYAIDAMGLTDKLHHELFAAIHEQRSVDPKGLLRDVKPLFDWVASKGVDAQKFADTYNSFSVGSRTQRAIDLTRSYDIPYTPALVIDGRYLISPSMKGNGNPDGSVNYEKFFEKLDQLIAQARSKPAPGK